MLSFVLCRAREHSVTGDHKNNEIRYFDAKIFYGIRTEIDVVLLKEY